MSYKLGLILSMIFVVMFFAFGIDLVSIQYAYSDLDAKSVAISYKLSEYGTIDYNIVNTIEESYNVEFTCLSNCAPLFGDIIDYKIARNINTLIVAQGSLEVSISRSAVIGYFA